MKKIILAALFSAAFSGLAAGEGQPGAAPALSLELRGMPRLPSPASAFPEPAPARVGERAGEPHFFALPVYSDAQGKEYLPKLAEAFERAGYPVISSAWYRHTDALGDPWWTINIDYLGPKSAVVKNYSSGYVSEAEARAALPGAVWKFKEAGYAILWDWVIWKRWADGSVVWYASICYITPARPAPGAPSPSKII